MKWCKDCRRNEELVAYAKEIIKSAESMGMIVDGTRVKLEALERHLTIPTEEA